MSKRSAVLGGAFSTFASDSGVLDRWDWRVAVSRHVQRPETEEERENWFCLAAATTTAVSGFFLVGFLDLEDVLGGSSGGGRGRSLVKW